MVDICDGCRVYDYGPHSCQLWVFKSGVVAPVPCGCAVDPTCSKGDTSIYAKPPGIAY